MSEWSIEEVSPQHYIVSMGKQNMIDFDLLPGLHHLTNAQRRLLIGRISNRVIDICKQFENSKIVTLRDGRIAEGQYAIYSIVLNDDGVDYDVYRDGKNSAMRYWDRFNEKWCPIPDGEYTLDAAYTLWRN